MIKAVGVDIVEIDRFNRVLHRWGARFTRRILTARELGYCQDKAGGGASMAVRFAAKEALFKCLSVSEGKAFRFQAVEIVNDRNGKPRMILHAPLNHRLRSRIVHVSMSHSNRSAIAVVVLEEGSDDTRNDR